MRMPRNAIKQAFDNLPTGICFADNTGRIVLINRAMGELIASLTDSYPQMDYEIENALKSDKVVAIKQDKPLYQFPDGKIWRFQISVVPNNANYIQITAQDMTELHQINLHLQKENEEMKRINVKLRQMHERLADQVREKETLDLKMRIHDNIGASLIAISELTRDGEDVDKQIAMLKDAVSYFSNDFPPMQNTFEEVRQRAAEMHVNLTLDGYIPPTEATYHIMLSAVRECITNCVKHAGGTLVNVRITNHSNFDTVIITNNGRIPEKEIVEGGGLSTLRRSVETIGGEMNIAYKPSFALILNLPREERIL